MLRPPFLDAEGLQRGRKLQTLTFRDKRALRLECIEVFHETSDEHGMLQMDAASADTFGAVVRFTGLAVHEPRPLSPSHQEHRSSAWHARPTCSDFALRSSPMHMR